MFERATTKVEDARTISEHLIGASDAPSFRSLFNSFLSSARAITYALQKEGKDVEGFVGWYSQKRDEMKGDELLRFIHEARTGDFHEGKHRLMFGTYIKHFSSEQTGPPPTNNAKLTVGAEGIFWIVDEGTPRERRIPIKGGGSFVTQITIANAPATHLGKNLEKNDPITICTLALTYFEHLVHEAKTKFEAK